MKTMKTIIFIFAFFELQASIAGTLAEPVKKCSALFELRLDKDVLRYKRIAPDDQPTDINPIFFSLLTSKDTHATLRKYLKNGGDPNICSPEGATLLILMVAIGDLKNVSLLIEHGASPNYPRDFMGGSPFNWSLNGTHYDVAQYLLDHGADPLSRDDTGFTSLFNLAINSPKLPKFNIARQLELAKRIIGAGEDVNAGSTSPLIFATLNNNIPLMRLLLENEANPRLKGRDGKSSLDYAESKGFQEALQLLKRYDTNKPNSVSGKKNP